VRAWVKVSWLLRFMGGCTGSICAMSWLLESEVNIGQMLSQCDELKKARVAMEVGINRLSDVASSFQRFS